jgi:hypothetical protein
MSDDSPLLAAKQVLDDANIPVDSRQSLFGSLVPFLAGQTDTFNPAVPRSEKRAWQQAFAKVADHIQQTPPTDSESSSDAGGSANEKIKSLIVNSPRRPFQSRVQSFTGSQGSVSIPLDDADSQGSASVESSPKAKSEEEEEEQVASVDAAPQIKDEEEDRQEIAVESAPKAKEEEEERPEAPPQEKPEVVAPEDEEVEITLTRKQWKILQARIQEAEAAEAAGAEEEEAKGGDTDTEQHQSGNDASSEDPAQSD